MYAQCGARVTATRSTAAQVGNVVTPGTNNPAQCGALVPVSRAAALGYLANTRYNGLSVWAYIGGAWEELLGIRGVVEWSNGTLDKADAYARFTLADDRVARFGASTISAGGIPIAIYVSCYSASGGAEWREWCGVTQASSNTENLLPAAQIQCEGWQTVLERQKGAAQAEPGSTRGDLILSALSGIGFSASGLLIPDGKTLTIPVDLAKTTPAELLRKVGEMEKFHWRCISDGTIEILPDSYLLGPPTIALDDDAIYTLTEQLPNRPPTSWTLTGVTPSPRSEAGRNTVRATNPDAPAGSEPVVTVTYDGDVEVYRCIEEPGVRKTERWRTWVKNVLGQMTGQLEAERTLVTEWFSPECGVNHGVAWSDGRYRLEASPGVFRPVREVYTTLTWLGCYLVGQTTTVKAYYGPLDSYGYTRADCLRWNGEYRTPTDTFTEIGREEITWYINDTGVTQRIASYAWADNGYFTRSDPPDPDITIPTESYKLVNVSVLSSTAVQGAGDATQTSQGAGGGATSQQGGELVKVPSASPTRPQQTIVPAQITYEVTGTGYLPWSTQEVCDLAQDTEDLLNIARRRASIELGTREPLTMPGVKGYMAGEPLSITAAERTLDKAGAYAESVVHRFNLQTGEWTMTVVPLIPMRTP